jgi:endonuclease III
MLQSVFETFYSFDLESLQRKPLGQATKVLEKLGGVTPFAVAFTIQMSLRGHAIPIDARLSKLLVRAGLVPEEVDPEELRRRLERWIPKSRGREFCGLLCGLVADSDGSKEPAVLRSVREEVLGKAQAKQPAVSRKPPAKKAAAPRPKKASAKTTKKSTR